MIETILAGRECEVTFREDVARGMVYIPTQNTANAEEGSKIRVTVRGSRFYLTAVMVEVNGNEARNNIQIRGPRGTFPAGLFEVISDPQFMLNKAWEAPKSRLSLIFTAFSIVTSAGAAFNSAQHAGTAVAACSGLSCVTPWTWIFFATSAVTAIGAWWRDNLTTG